MKFLGGLFVALLGFICVSLFAYTDELEKENKYLKKIVAKRTEK